jgi:arylsulfatase A-like enzyme
LAPYAPHAPATPAPRHQNAFPGIKAPRPPSFNEADVTDKPEWVQELGELDDDQIKHMDDQYRRRRQSLLAVDEMVQNIIFTLKAKGQLENTYIFFTSDNGYHQGQHRMESGKLTAYEEDILIPLWVRGPGVAAGRKIDNHITANVDYAGTFADIAGLATPSFVDGRSLLPLLRGLTPPAWRAALLLENKGGEMTPLFDTDAPLDPLDPFERTLQTRGDGPGITGFSGLRVNDGTTYIEYVSNEFELYDNQRDPYQLTNAFLDTSSETRAKLARWVAKLKYASGAELRQAEQAPPPR